MEIPDKKVLFFHAKVSGCRDEQFNGDQIIRVFTRVALPMKFNAQGINSLFNSMPNGRILIDLGDEIPEEKLPGQVIQMDFCISAQPMKVGHKTVGWRFKSATAESADMRLKDRYQ
jgi:hypothetical protein